MKDIKQLYSTAKERGWNSDIRAYSEGIDELISSDPHGYVTQLEYIITTSPGVRTLKTFTEKYGFSFALYNEAMQIIQESIRKCERDGKPTTTFDEMVGWMESFRKDNIDSFIMYEWYCNDDNNDYLEAYYSANKNGVQNKLLAKGMIDKFGESAVPDLIATAKAIGEGAIQRTLSLLETYEQFDSPLFCEYMNSIGVKCESASTIVREMRARNAGVYRESVITGENLNYEYTQGEIDAIRDLISFNEYRALWSDELGVNQSDIMENVYSLYDEIDGMEFTEADESNKSDEELVPVFILLRGVTKDKEILDKYKDDLTPKDTAAGKAINFFTNGDVYQHALIAFDDQCDELYSFEGFGIKKDSMDNPIHKVSQLYLSCLFVPKADKERMHKLCKDLNAHPEETKYAYMDLVHMFFGIKQPKQGDNRFVCSAFVAFLLAGANPKNIHRDYSNIRPEDATIFPRSFYIGTYKNIDDWDSKKNLVKQKVAAIKDLHMEELEEYNNELPKLLLQDAMRKHGAFDKLVEDIMYKIYRGGIVKKKDGGE